jgi:hypothetical protein
MLMALQAHACPVCNSGTGKQVREGIFAADLGLNLAAAAAPFAICAVIVRLMSAGQPR